MSQIPQAAIERARPYAADLAEGDGTHVGFMLAGMIREGGNDHLRVVQMFAKAIADEQERCARFLESEGFPALATEIRQLNPASNS